MSGFSKVVSQNFQDISPRVQVTVIVVTSLGFIIGWSWSTFFSNAFNRYVDPGNKTISDLIYAIVVTVLIIVIAWFLFKYVVDRK